MNDSNDFHKPSNLRKQSLLRWGEDFNDLPKKIQNILTKAEIVKAGIKSGCNTKNEYNLLVELADTLNSVENRVILKEKKLDAFYQTMAILSEQFYRWGNVNKAREYVDEAEEILDAIAIYNEKRIRKHILDSHSKYSKEQIRYCLAYIQASSYQNQDNKNYENSIQKLEDCEKYVEHLLEQTGGEWNGTLALIKSHLGRFYRNILKYKRAINAFGQSISYYEKRLQQEPDKPYKRNTSYLDTEKKFVQHRTAIVLILGYAWTDIQRGRLYQALYNSLIPAKALLTGMNDILLNNYLNLLEVSAMRWLSLPSYVRRETNLKQSIFKTQSNYSKSFEMLGDFRDLEIDQFLVRALFEHALCAEYCENWDEAEEIADEMIELSTKLSDKFWRVRAHLLKVRVLFNRHYNEGRKDKENIESKNKKIISLESDILSLFRDVADDHNVSIYTNLEYHLNKGEALLTWKQYPDAIKEFETTLNINRSPLNGFSNKSLNPKIEAHCRLRMAQIFEKTEKYFQAEQQINIWNQSLSVVVDNVYLRFLAERVRRNLESKIGIHIKIDNSSKLNYYDWEIELKKFIAFRAGEIKIGENLSWEKIAEQIGISRTTLIDWRNGKYISESKKKKKR